VQEVAHDISNQYFDKEFQNYTNRPDVIVLEIRDPDTQTYEYLITEVKTARTPGLSEPGSRKLSSI